MDERNRRLPQVPPGLALRQSGNFISVRQKPDQDGGWGTLSSPKQFSLPLLKPHRLRSRLGYEAVPSSEFWQFHTTGRIRLQVNRLSDDRYANSVGVALLNTGNQRVAPLVQSNSGRGEPVEIGPGTFKIVASLGLAENLKDLVFELLATPVGGSLKAVGVATGSLWGRLMPRRPLGPWTHFPSGAIPGPWLAGRGEVWINGIGKLGLRSKRLLGIGAALIGGDGVLLRASHRLHGQAWMQLPAHGKLTRLWPQRLQGMATAGPLSASGRMAAVRWLDEPWGNWRARVNAGVVELNRPYVHFDVDPPSQQRLVFWLQGLLGAPDGGDFHIGEADTHLHMDLDGGQLDKGTAAGDSGDWLDGGYFP